MAGFTTYTPERLELGCTIAPLQLKTKASQRNISFDAYTGTQLAALKRAQTKLHVELGPAYRTDLDLVFCRADGSPLDPDVVTHQFQRLASRARVPIIPLHSLRHTMATLMLAEGRNPKVVQERLGHASIKTTLDQYSK